MLEDRVKFVGRRLCHYFFGLRKISQSHRRKENGEKEDIVHLLLRHFLFRDYLDK
jgi:hypothetical protein